MADFKEGFIAGILGVNDPIGCLRWAVTRIRKGDKMKKHNLLISVVMVLLIFLVYEPWVPQSLGQRVPKVVKIGAIYPITGSLSQTGMQFVQAAKVVQDLINKRYDIDSPGNIFRSEGLPNLGGAKIEVIFGDSESKPDVGRAQAERLIELEKVVALIGSYQSSVTEPVSAAAEAKGIPFLCDSASAPSLTERGFKWFFRTNLTDASNVEGSYLFLQEMKKNKPDLKLEKIAVVCEDTRWGQDVGRLVREQAQKFGHKIILDVAYPHEATDVEAEGLRIKKENPDIIWMASYLSDAVLFHKTFKKYDVTAAIIANPAGHARKEFVDSLGSDANGVIASQLWSDALIKTNKMAAIFTDLVKKRFGEGAAVGELPARGYIGMLTLVDAINRAGSTDPNAIRQALLKTDIPGNLLPLPWRGVKFDEKHQNKYGGVIMVQWLDQRMRVIWPKDVAETEPILPLPPWSKR